MKRRFVGFPLRPSPTSAAGERVVAVLHPVRDAVYHEQVRRVVGAARVLDFPDGEYDRQRTGSGCSLDLDMPCLAPELHLEVIRLAEHLNRRRAEGGIVGDGSVDCEVLDESAQHGILKASL